MKFPNCDQDAPAVVTVLRKKGEDAERSILPHVFLFINDGHGPKCVAGNSTTCATPHWVYAKPTVWYVEETTYSQAHE